jgi:hypothetical protein
MEGFPAFGQTSSLAFGVGNLLGNPALGHLPITVTSVLG